MNKKYLFIFLLCISLIFNAVLSFLLVNDVYANNQASQTQQINLRVLSFTGLFIEKVLMSNQEVDFDTRLALETMVRNLNDQEILQQWEKFTGATDGGKASTEAKVLLNILVKKIAY